MMIDDFYQLIRHVNSVSVLFFANGGIFPDPCENDFDCGLAAGSGYVCVNGECLCGSTKCDKTANRCYKVDEDNKLCVCGVKSNKPCNTDAVGVICLDRYKNREVLAGSVDAECLVSFK